MTSADYHLEMMSALSTRRRSGILYAPTLLHASSCAAAYGLRGIVLVC